METIEPHQELSHRRSGSNLSDRDADACPENHTPEPQLRGPLGSAVGLLQLIHRNPALAQVAKQKYELRGDMFATGDPAYLSIQVVAHAALRLAPDSPSGCTCANVLPLLSELRGLPKKEPDMRRLAVQAVRLLEVLDSKPGVTMDEFDSLAQQVRDHHQEHLRRRNQPMCSYSGCRFPSVGQLAGRPFCATHVREMAKVWGLAPSTGGS